MRGLLLILIIIIGSHCLAQNKSTLSEDSLKNIPFINTIEQSLNLFYNEYSNDTNLDSLKKAIEENGGVITKVSDDTICSRLDKINSMTPFQLQCNETTLSRIKFFLEKRQGFIKIVLGRSPLYFDMFEAKLSEYGLPIELKYLSVIESGLRPQVKSRAGALGLWQFMYKTGLYMGLKENSFIDERMDPNKATDAACRYLKKLFGIYGDWNLALAAYNAGPGNVNKAIIRSGNKKTYWQVRPYLPSETQGYVPNFIAVAYLMTFHKEHLIAPINNNPHNIILDTMCFKSAIHMGTISKVIDWPLEDIKAFNPVYKTSFIPKTNPPFCISGPHEKINLVVGLEDSLIKLEKSIYGSDEVEIKKVFSTDTTTGDTIQKNVYIYYHKVRTGEVLKNVAVNYGVTENQIMSWNGLKTTNIYNGQHLRIETEKKVLPPKPKPKPKPASTKKYYTVKSGDTFGHIAERHRMSQSRLRKLNPRINIHRLNIGQKIRIR
jgi:membrane-bound lytic murein transglycosylase D